MRRGSRYLPEEDESERDASDIWSGGGEAIQEQERGEGAKGETKRLMGLRDQV